jgi:hypothetical protein
MTKKHPFFWLCTLDVFHYLKNRARQKTRYEGYSVITKLKEPKRQGANFLADVYKRKSVNKG